jgi:hypothetical protein
MEGRANRRFQKEIKTKNRVKQQYRRFTKDGSFAKFLEDVKDGMHHQYLKHTGTICSCNICKRERYSKKDRKNNKNVDVIDTLLDT